uniref:PAS domain S-box protein n=1 Tax=uncultured Imperialibacter sp. TaxID=1672639 RepID=UPI0030DA5BC2
MLNKSSNHDAQRGIDFGVLFADHIGAMLAYWDKNEVCQFANKAYREWFGKSHEQMVGKITMQELLGPLYEKNQPFIAEVLKGNPQHFERELTLPSREARNVQANYYPDIQNGEVMGFLVHVADISATKKLEKEIAASEMKFRGLLESAPDAIVLVDETGSINMVNAMCEKLFGYTRDELLGKPIEILIPERFGKAHPGQRSGFFANPHARPMGEGLELFGLKKNGTEFPVEISISPIELPEGMFVSAAIRDISWRKRVEREVNASNERNKIFVEQSPTAMAMFDTEMRYMAASRRWIEDYQLSGSEILGRSHYEIFPEIGDDWKRM